MTAACLGADPRQFDIDTPRRINRDAARTFCAGCPDRLVCLEQARACGDVGVRGGVLLRRRAPEVDLISDDQAEFVKVQAPRHDPSDSSSRRPLKPCGTRAAAERHRVAGEPICPPCRAAARADRRARTDQARNGAPPRILRPCGTHSAYVRHLNHGEVPCEPCRTAHRAYDVVRKRARYARRKVAG